MSLKTKTIQSIKWSFAGNIGKSVLQFGIVIVLARLLEPKDYGVIALANLFTRFGFRFIDTGLGLAIIQLKEIDDQDVRVSYTLATIMGLVIGLAVFLAAPLGTVIFDNPIVSPVIRVLAFSFLLGGFGLTSQSLLRRNLNYKTFAKIEVSAYLMGKGLVTIICAALGFGVWSLVVGILTTRLITTVACFLAVRHSLCPIFKISAYRRCLSLGARFSINSLLDFLYNAMNVLFIGFFFGDRVTGLFDRAKAFANFPANAVLPSINRVLFPTYSRLQYQKKKAGQLFLTNLMFQGMLCASVAGAIILASREIVLVCLGNKWIELIVPLQIVVCSIYFSYLASVSCSVLDGFGKLNLRFRGRIYGILFRLACYTFSLQYGFHGLLFGIAIAEFLQLILYWFFAFRTLELRLAGIPKVVLLLFGQGVGTATLVFVVTWAGRWCSAPKVVILVGQVIVGGVALVVSLIFLHIYAPMRIRRDVLTSLPFIDVLMSKLRLQKQELPM